jgi:hypothetical protein
MMNAKIRKVNGINVLEVQVPLNDSPIPSASGKTRVVASTHGNKVTALQVEGFNVTVGLNAYIPNNAGVTANEPPRKLAQTGK